MKRKLCPLLCAASMLLVGCAAQPEPVTLSPSTSPSASPSASPMASPMTTGSPMISPGTSEGAVEGAIDSLTDSMTSGVSGTSASSTAANGVTDAAQAKRLSQEAEDELEKLSEVSDAQVVIAGHTAAVALEFDSQYQGGVDERLRKMVKQRIDGLVKGVKDVSVTDDNTLYERLETLGDRLDGSAALSEIETELKDIIAGIEA